MFTVEIESIDRVHDLSKLRLSSTNGLQTELVINPYTCFDDYIPDPSLSSLDVLYFTSIIYAIDKLLPRAEANDNWSRDIEVCVPVSDGTLWNLGKDEFKKALDFLTGDNWILSFKNIEIPFYQSSHIRLPITERFEHLCLFSGGLDSLAGAIDLIHENNNILLISHIDGHGANIPLQTNLISKIKDAYPTKLIKQSGFHVYNQDNNHTNETTTRGRSILFHGLAIFHAINFGIDKIMTPENGVISINLPLTPSRTCSNSTKTMHPYFIKKFQNALSLIGLNIELVNPYIYKTKGEMLLENKNHNLIRELATKTLSCSHGGGHTLGWYRQSNNCGYCIPCTIRRASIHKFDSSVDNGLEYGHNIGNREISLNTQNDKRLDLLALSYFLNRNLSLNDLKREIKLMANIDDVDTIANMLQRGYSEIKEYIDAKANDDIKRLFY